MMHLLRKLFNPDNKAVDKAAKSAIQSSDDLSDASRRLEDVLNQLIKDQRRSLGRPFPHVTNRHR